MDTVKTKARGFDYRLEKALVQDKNGKRAWFGGAIKMAIDCPKDFAGTLYVHFQDIDTGKREPLLRYLDHPWFLGPAKSEDVWVAVEIKAKDTASGSIILEGEALPYSRGSADSRGPGITEFVLMPGK